MSILTTNPTAYIISPSFITILLPWFLDNATCYTNIMMLRKIDTLNDVSRGLV